MATKPNIANPEIEYDARTLTALPQVDFSDIATWPDTSGQGNDATQFANTRRFEERGFNGTEPDVRLLGVGDDDRFGYDGTVFEGVGGFTWFAVIQVLDLTTGFAIMGSAVSSSFPRFPSLLILPDGSITYNHSADPYNIQSAAGVIVVGTKYVISSRLSTATGMILRVNGVQVGADAGAVQGIVDNQSARIGEHRDSTTGGLGQAFGEQKQFAWVSGYSSEASAGQMDDLERFLADRFNVPGLGTSRPKPTISNPEMEFDVNSLSALTDGDLVEPWPDTSGQGNDAFALNVPKYEAGAWGDDHRETVRLLEPVNGGSFNFDGTPFVATDLTMFLVFRMFRLTAAFGNALIGGSSFTDFAQVELFIRLNGAIVFSFGTDEGAPLAAESAVGLVSPDETCHVLTVRHSNSSGKIIRLDGVQVASNPSATGNLTQFPGARIGEVANVIFIEDTKIPWVAGYSFAASVAEMAQMEAFLTELWCDPITPPGLWVPTFPEVDTTWVPS